MVDEDPNSNLDNNNPENASKEIPEQADEAENKISSNSPEIETPAKASEATNDTQTEQAVDQIVKQESDEVLAAEDGRFAKLLNHPKNLQQKLTDAFHSWWNNQRLRYGTLAGLALILIIVAILPPSRDWALNIVGVRGNASVTVVDKTTNLPLKDVSVSLAGKETTTNNNGVATLNHIHLGSQKLIVQKVAFAVLTKKIRIGMGGNNLGRLALTAIGVQYNFAVTDYLSSQPIVKAEADSGGSSAFSDAKGKIILTALSSKATTLAVTVSANGYNNATINIPVGSAAVNKISLVPAGKEVYISNANGLYDVYSSDLDGQNKKLLLAGTGNENSNIGLSVSPDGSEAALVSTRDNLRDSDGFLLSAVTLINVSTGSSVTIDHAEQVQLIGWSGTRLVYGETIASASAANPAREHITSYDYSKNSRISVATANQFNGVVEANGAIYYAVSSTDPSAQAYFFKINPDGTNKQTLLTKEVWTIFQTNYNTFGLQTPDGWYSYTLGGKSASSSTQPANLVSYDFIDNQAGTKSLWVDNRDGKGVLLAHDIAGNKDTTLASQGGLTEPMRWVGNDVAIYRVSTQQETADYAVSVAGGSPKKITDVTTSYGIGGAYGY